MPNKETWRAVMMRRPFFARLPGLRTYPKKRCGACGQPTRKGWQLWCERCDTRVPEELQHELVSEVPVVHFWALVRKGLRLLRRVNFPELADSRLRGPYAE